MYISREQAGDVCTHMCAFGYSHTCRYRYTHVKTYVHNIHTYTYTFVHKYPRTYIQNIYLFRPLQTYAQAYIRINTHTFIHEYT